MSPTAEHIHDEFLTVPVDTQASMTDLLLVRSREAGIAERTAALLLCFSRVL
jgi:hypothetical protein